MIAEDYFGKQSAGAEKEMPDTLFRYPASRFNKINLFHKLSIGYAFRDFRSHHRSLHLEVLRSHQDDHLPEDLQSLHDHQAGLPCASDLAAAVG